MSERRGISRRELTMAGIIFAFLVLRAVSFGVEYWPQLDDYIQLHNYASAASLMQLQQSVGLLASRPLAGAMDYYVWGKLFDVMIVGVILISALYTICVFWMGRLLGRYVPVGPVFPVVMALLPLGVEGTYWVSASNRIVVGLFCACLTAQLFLNWLDRGGLLRAVLFALAMPLPFGFYEQSAVLAMTMVLGIALLEFRKKRGRVLLALWVLPSAALYFVVTAQFALDNAYSNRAEVILPVSLYWFKVFFPEVLGQMSTVFLKGGFYTLVKGFVRSVRMILTGKLILWTLAAAACAFVYGRVACGERRSRGQENHLALGVVIGVLLTIAPLTPFYILGNPWFSFRGAVTSFAGLALLADLLLCTLGRELFARRGERAIAFCAAAMAFVFCLAGASEIGDYRGTYESDQRAASAVLRALEEYVPDTPESGGVRVGFLGMEPSYLPNQNYFWHEHVTGCTESNWALTGLVASRRERSQLPGLYPLPADPIYRSWNREMNRPEGFDLLFYYDGQTMIRVTLEQTGEHDFLVMREDGTQLGRIWEESDGLGYFRLTEKSA